VAELLLLIVRGAVALSCGAAGVVALTHWLLRRGTLSPFGGWARLVRGASGTVVKATEGQVLRRGGNPQDAPYWLLGVAVLGGLILTGMTQWIIGYLQSVSWAVHNGPRGVLLFVVTSACDLLALALFVRVIGSWFGIGRYTPWMRPVYSVTDWLVLPIQRRLPATGMLDFSPMVAWLVVVVVRAFLVRIL
jgi:YggT family protein